MLPDDPGDLPEARGEVRRYNELALIWAISFREDLSIGNQVAGNSPSRTLVTGKRPEGSVQAPLSALGQKRGPGKPLME